MEQIVYKTCDVLIVGSGLAGLRAGISTLSQSRDLTVRIATQGRGVSGSSFTNPNHALGMIVCQNSLEKDAFIKKAMDIAPPGMVFPELVSVLAEESGFFYHDLVQTGLDFMRDTDGENRRFPACFLRDPLMAYVFKGLGAAYLLLNKRFYAHGGEIWECLSLLDLVMNEEQRVIGAVFEETATGRIWAVQCQALIMATGGAAGLFPRNLTDSGNLGIPLSLMHQAGARIINMNFLQYLWYRHDSWEPWPCWSIGNPGVAIRDNQGQEIVVSKSILSLLQERGRHVPVAHGRDDSDVDALLCDQADSNQRILIRVKGEGEFEVALYAHALNGGVLIDSMARTGVPGLFAAGECTGGMHGANRVGGAMVLSSQVFGHRAGISAARFAHDPGQEPRRRFMGRVSPCLALKTNDGVERRKGLEQLQRLLSGSEGPFPRPGIETRIEKISTMIAIAQDHRLKQALTCARMMLT